MSPLLLIILTSSFNIISSINNCSAINSYIQITYPSDLINTLTSSKALFPPYNYYVSSTELATLNTTTDDICTTSGLTTDISNKIVLIFESHGECTTHYKVYVAQQNNAIAVIAANNDVSGEIVPIPDDDLLASSGLTTSIPTRSISLSEGTILQNTISSGTAITVAFECFDTLYPTHICILDTEGELWYLDGDYQRQESTFNDHPVYKKEGYVYLLPNVYIFQHVMSGDTDWYWSITLDPSFTDDMYIRARCAYSSISDPSLCPSWNATNQFNRHKNSAYSLYPSLNATEGLCSISDSYICITSSESDLRGLDGIYRQFNKNVPFWFRELDDCDTRPGWFLFDYPQFTLMDSLNGWTVAQCTISDLLLPLVLTGAIPDPALCTEWETIINDTLLEELSTDDTLSVTECTVASSTCTPSTSAPDKFCMEKSSVMHGFLEGEYMETGVIGPYYNTHEYIRSDALFYDGEYIEVYVWWFGEINPDEHSWWVLSRSNLTEAIAANGAVSLYAYCESKTMSPTDCAAAWNFYFVTAFHPDFHFNVYDGACTSGQASEDYLWPDYVCIGFINDTVGSESEYVSGVVFSGGYEINSTGTVLSGGSPHWMKPKNSEYNVEMYLYYDAFFGYWQIGTELHVQNGAVLFCFQENDYSPVDCNGWYDAWLSKMDNMYLYECTDEDVMRISTETKSNVGIVVGVVLGFLVFSLCVFVCCFRTRVQRGQASFRMDTTMDTDIGGKERRVDSTAGLANNAAIKKIDFTPLQIDSPAQHRDDTSGDEADFTEKSGTENTEKMEATAMISKSSSTKGDGDADEVGVKDHPIVSTIGNDDEEEDEEEKKDETEQPIDNRRMSQQMISAMQNTLNEWTSALIQDPTDAATRYSKTSKQDIDKIQKMYKDIMDPVYSEQLIQDNKADDEKKVNEDDKDTDNDKEQDNKEDEDEDKAIDDKDVIEIDKDTDTDNDNDKETDEAEDEETNNPTDQDKPAEWTTF